MENKYLFIGCIAYVKINSFEERKGKVRNYLMTCVKYPSKQEIEDFCKSEILKEYQDISINKIYIVSYSELNKDQAESYFNPKNFTNEQ